MNADQLLNEVEALTHHARSRRMVEVSRLPTQEREPVVAELAIGSIHARRPALSCCYCSRDGARVGGCSRRIGERPRPVYAWKHSSAPMRSEVMTVPGE